MDDDAWIEIVFKGSDPKNELPVIRLELDRCRDGSHPCVRDVEPTKGHIPDVDRAEIARQGFDLYRRFRFTGAHARQLRDEKEHEVSGAHHRPNSVARSCPMATVSQILAAGAAVVTVACTPSPRGEAAENGSDPETVEGVLVGDHEITDQASLADLVGFWRLDGSLLIESDLVDLTGLEELRRIDRDLIIRNNEFLDSLDGLIGLATVGALELRNNAVLASLSGIDELAGVDGDLTIEANPVLTVVGGLDTVRRVGGAVVLVDNPGLVGLAGLNGVETTGTFWVSDNPVLNDLDGFAALDTVDEFLVFENAALPTCAVEALLARLEVAGTSYVDGNAPCP